MFALNEKGSYFGDVEFVECSEKGEVDRLFAVKAKSDVELLMLQK